jgi:small subunit ribosomal protein S7
MPRRNRPARRQLTPDSLYHSPVVQEFINRMMRSGKRSVAKGVLYKSLAMVQTRANREPLEVLESAIKNVSPAVEVKPRRVGGANYQVPVEVPPDRRMSLAMRWILAAARTRPGKSMAERLANELLDASNNQGAAIKRREEVHRMAEANRAFAHYRW